ncbi:MAG TPA: DUF4349 domain-containing protein [Candidatus Acidoferrales bacterium]|nr:DUF4349 domain-containing protein [Candidatus Acidoferrales bacterium]
MPDAPNRLFIVKRLLIAVAALAAFTMATIIGSRLVVESLFKGIASSRSSALSAISWDVGSMWSSGATGVDMLQKGVAEPWIARSADLRARSSAFDHSLASLHQIVSAHHGYLEDLRTESRSGYGRALAATVSVPSKDFDATLADLKALGRVVGISEAGEDFAVKLATAARRLSAAQTNLSRLQKLQRERKGELRDAVALEKDIAQANEAVDEAERQNQGLVSTVAQAHIRLTLMEDYRAPLPANLEGFFLPLRNSFVEGVGAIFSSAALVLGVLFEFGLPLLFWLALLFFPIRLAWRRFRRAPAAATAVS